MPRNDKLNMLIRKDFIQLLGKRFFVERQETASVTSQICQGLQVLLRLYPSIFKSLTSHTSSTNFVL